MLKEGIAIARTTGPSVTEDLKIAIERSQSYLLQIQDSRGFWSGELEADVSVTAGYIPLMHFMGVNDPVRWQKAINYARSQQLPDGGWSACYDGPGDLNVSIQTYFALKLGGVPQDEPHMQRARDFIRDQGGIERAHTFTKILLAIFGQYDWARLPSIPPELMLAPDRSFFTIYDFASWARATIVALMVVLNNKPVCLVPEPARLDELYVKSSQAAPRQPLAGWRSIFLTLDQLFKAYDKSPAKPFRKQALRKAEDWIVAHQEVDGSWGGIMLPWVYSLIALKSLGYSLEHPVIKNGLKGLDDFIIEDQQTMRLEPAVSPVWDTALALIALRDSGLPASHPAAIQAARWLLSEQINVGGDWQVKNPKTQPGGWPFEFRNNAYPDIDDSAVVCLALTKTGLDHQTRGKAVRRGLDWVLSMQCKDGGWAAFDLNNDKRFLVHVPFADFMTPLDPTSPDVTAHVVELLGVLGYQASRLDRAKRYLKRTQEADGSWFGRWGVNYIYGTSAVLVALRAAGEDTNASDILRAEHWLKAHQNSDGGWGESCHSYEDASTRGVGTSTASQTAWALLGLLACGQGSSNAVQKGIDFLLTTQQPDGSWQESDYTGTGFPRAFYLRYHLYSSYFPLMALGRYKAFLEEDDDDTR